MTTTLTPVFQVLGATTQKYDVGTNPNVDTTTKWDFGSNMVQDFANRNFSDPFALNFDLGAYEPYWDVYLANYTSPRLIIMEGENYPDRDTAGNDVRQFDSPLSWREGQIFEANTPNAPATIVIKFQAMGPGWVQYPLLP